MSQKSLDLLRSTPEDYGFHTQRTMFWIVNGKIVVGPAGTSMSHSEMAESMGWLKGDNNSQFFNENPRGFYLKNENRLHFYQGIGFNFDDQLKKQIIEILPQIKENLNLKEDVDVFFGPKDRIIKGIEYPIEKVGTIGELIVRK